MSTGSTLTPGGNEFWQPGTGARQIGYAALARASRVDYIKQVIRVAGKCEWTVPWLYTADGAIARSMAANSWVEWTAMPGGTGLADMLATAAQAADWRRAQPVALPGMRIPVLILDFDTPMPGEVAEFYRRVVDAGPAGGVSTVLVVPESSPDYTGPMGASLQWTAHQWDH